jgi:hypothetical protein
MSSGPDGMRLDNVSAEGVLHRESFLDPRAVSALRAESPPWKILARKNEPSWGEVSPEFGRRSLQHSLPPAPQQSDEALPSPGVGLPRGRIMGRARAYCLATGFGLRFSADVLQPVKAPSLASNLSRDESKKWS